MYEPAATPVADADPPASPSTGTKSGLRDLPAAFWRYAAFSAVTMAGFATFGLIGFHLVDRGLLKPATVPLVYALAMATDAVAALAVGRLFDRYGLRVLAALPVLAAAGTALAFSATLPAVLTGAALWGAAMGVQESTMRAEVADLVAPARRATAYGIFAASYGLAWLAGGALLGALYGHAPSALAPTVVAIQALALMTLWWVARANGRYQGPNSDTTA